MGFNNDHGLVVFSYVAYEKKYIDGIAFWVLRNGVSTAIKYKARRWLTNFVNWHYLI